MARDQLTQKQKKFADGVISGLSQKDAYKAAYSTKNMKEKTISREASTLMNNEKVATYINKRTKEEDERQREKYELDRDAALESYLWLMSEAKESIEMFGIRQATANAYISSLDKACTLLDLYPDKKQSVKLSGDLNTNVNPYANLTEEELRKLIDDDK